MSKNVKMNKMGVELILKVMLSMGIPMILSMVLQALMSFMTYGVNIIFCAVSTAAVTSYGIFYKIQQFVFFAGFGLRDAITPIVSFNYGMGDKKRVKDGIKYGVIYVSIIMIAETVLLEIFAVPLVTLFGMSDETAQLCIALISIISAGFFFAGGNIALQGDFRHLDVELVLLSYHY